MLKTKPLPGQKIRCVDDGGFSFFTEGKIYEVLDKEDDENTVWFIDDDRDENTTYVMPFCYKGEFELVLEENHMQTNDSSNTSKQVKPDEFRVGDVVWCLLNGEGQVVNTGTNAWSDFNIEVQFKNTEEDETWFYTDDGKLNECQNRSLYFSEPKIEASVTRPFVPTLVGKRVVVLEYACYPQVFVVTWEDASTFGNDEYKCSKSNSKVYEASSENLLKT